MRVRSLVAAMVAAATCVLTGVTVSGQPPKAAAQDCVRPSGPMVAYGHSYLHSPGIGGAPSSYATLASTALGLKPSIRAVDGGTSLNVDNLVHRGTTRWVPGSADVVLIDSAINDILKRVPTEQWTAALRRTLNTFAAPPVPLILLMEPLPVYASKHPGSDPDVIDDYAETQRAIAEEFSAVRIVDAEKGWIPRAHLSLDGIHPNAAGMLHIARAVRASAARSLCSP